MRRLICIAVLLTVAGCAAPFTGEQRYVVFFEEWSARLNDGGSGVVGAAVAEAKAHPNERVQVIGFADPTGTPQANVDISRTRAQVVADSLIAQGIDTSRITRSARGATNFTLMSQESRRVEIVVAP